MGPPSTEQQNAWIEVESPTNASIGTFLDDGGKWMIFRSRETIDAEWEKIALACRAGKLRQAKVSTRHPLHRRYGGKHVICVYTRSSKRDQTMARNVLTKLGFVEILHWKSNEMTIDGQRGSLRSV